MSFRVRTCRDLGEFGSAVFAVGQYFALDPTEERMERFSRNLPVERMHAAFEGREIVGGAGAFPFEMTVPGGVVPTAGVTVVGTAPTHRRRGVLRALMRAQLDDVHERGEPVAALWASEETIYGRFGYGMATQGIQLDVELDRVRFAEGLESSGRIRLMPRDEALPVMLDVYERFAPTRPGATGSDLGTLAWHLYEKKDEPNFYAIHDDDQGTPDAFAVYRMKHEWPESLPHVELKLRQLIATSAVASHSMWRYLFDVDLVSRVTSEDRPVDEPLLWQLEEPRAARPRLLDALYARPLDVAGALSARGYAADGRVTIGVRDRFRPGNDGVYELTADEGRGTCRRTDREPDLRADVSALGATYLGAVTWSTLALAGRVEPADPRALATADRLFATPVAPWAPFFF